MKRVVPLLAALATACAAATPPEEASMSDMRVPDLAGSEWGPADAPDIFIRFGGEGDMAGSGGCNAIGASYVQDGEVLTIGPIRATRRACDIPTMDAEQAFLEVLEATERVGMEDDGRLGLLVLRDANGTALAKLTRRDWD